MQPCTPVSRSAQTANGILYHRMAMPCPMRHSTLEGRTKLRHGSFHSSSTAVGRPQEQWLVIKPLYIKCLTYQALQGACAVSMSISALQNVTVLNPFLCKLDYDSYSKLVLRQAPPLPAVPQPPNGHSLAFYILEGVCLQHFHLY